MDILHGVAQVPEAIGGGALDILIGDRTNVSPGEQAKRAIQALLLGGDHGENLLALQHVNAQSDALNGKAVSSPQFQDVFQQLQQSGMSDQEAYAQAAKLYGVSGYSPSTQQETNRPVADDLDAAIGQAGGAPLGRVPLSQPESHLMLPPPSAADRVKYEKSQTQLNATRNPDPIEAVVAQYKLAGIPVPPALMRARSERMLPEARPGLETRNLTFNPDGTVSATMNELPLEQRFYTRDAVGEAQADLDIARTNAAAMKLGIPDRVVKTFGRDGIGVGKTTDPFTRPLATAAVGEFSETHDPRIFELYNHFAQPNGGPPPSDAAQPTPGGTTAAPPAGAPLQSRAERRTQAKVQTELRTLQTQYPDAVIAQPDGTLARNPTFKGTVAAKAGVAAGVANDKTSQSMATAIGGAEAIRKLITPDALPQGSQFPKTVDGAVDMAVYTVGQYLRAKTPTMAGNESVAMLDRGSDALRIPLAKNLKEQGIRFTQREIDTIIGILPHHDDTIDFATQKVDWYENAVRALNALPPGSDATEVIANLDAYRPKPGGGNAPTTAAAPNAQPTPAAAPAGIDPDLAAVIARRRAGPQ